MRIICFDTETSGLPKNYKAPVTDIDNWPRIIQMAWVVFDEEGVVLQEYQTLINPNGEFTIPAEASKVHGITTEMAILTGRDIKEVIAEFVEVVEGCNVMIGHNMKFDMAVIDCEIVRMNMVWMGIRAKPYDTMIIGTNLCKIPGKVGFKWPKLEELHKFLFPNEEMKDAHDALGDVRSTANCFLEMIKIGAVKL